MTSDQKLALINILAAVGFLLALLSWAYTLGYSRGMRWMNDQLADHIEKLTEPLE